MILTLILLGTTAALSVGAKFGYSKYAKFRDKKIFEKHFNLRTVLPDNEWQKLKQTIKDECVGRLYSDALIKEVLNQDYRFSCKQIYEIRKMYNWMENHIDHINDLTYYLLSAKADAEEKIFALLNENVLLLNKNSEMT